ncbi:MAG: flagellar hook-basal body complex protein FliE [Desulfitobacteriaceae bacterium]
MGLISGITPLMPLTPLNQTVKLDSILNQTNLKTMEGAQKAGTDFANFLKDAMHQVDTLQKNSDAASIGIATGQSQDLHTAMVALEKANLSLSLTVEVRNKVLDAYNQIMRMQI